MVTGLDTFRRFFAGHNDSYVLIGGAACDVWFSQAGIRYRSTKDFDVVLCVEVVDTAFAERFAAFLEAGGYIVRATAEQDRKFFRFENPTDKSFPEMLELFSRPPATLTLPASDRYVRLNVADAILSLSALLLDDHYYEALKSGGQVVDGVSILGPELLIAFKARAFLDLTARRANGENVDSADIRKHRNDVFRLIQLLRADGGFRLAKPIFEDLRRFIAAMATDGVNPPDFQVQMTRDEGLNILRRVYSLRAGQ